LRLLVIGGSITGLTLFTIWAPGEQLRILGRALVAQRSLILASLVLVLLGLSLLWARGQEIDNRAFLFFNLWGYRPRWLDISVAAISQIGNGLAATGYALYLYFHLNRDLALQIALGTLTLSILVEGLKEVTNRARPFLANAGTRVIGWREPGRSFPSGHTAQIFFMVTLLNHHFSFGAWAQIGLYALAVAIGFTRIYVGAHYPRDVLGGAVLGIVWGSLANLIDPYWVTIL
jgi:membrane-associated phospholipid phosphatase